MKIEKETKEVKSKIDYSKEIKPVLNRVLIELLKEKKDYALGNISIEKAENKLELEIYVSVIATGDTVKSCKPGDFALINPNQQVIPFEVDDRSYSIIEEYSIMAVISPKVADYFREKRISEAFRNKIKTLES